VGGVQHIDKPRVTVSPDGQPIPCARLPERVAKLLVHREDLLDAVTADGAGVVEVELGLDEYEPPGESRCEPVGP
jgi:hypothetical protein